LRQALQTLAEQGITVKFDKIHKVLGEGNFVLVVSEGNFAGQPTSFYDLFRVENGKIAEHWDTTETIPPREQWKNDNGKF
jgi:predicted SnoaL-like aldol condensation-catalyzing enzyme